MSGENPEGAAFEAGEAGAGWDDVNAAVAEARALVAAEAADADALVEGEAYVTRVLTAALSSAVLGHRHTQGGLATALPVHGGPNPDYILRHSVIAPGGQYRLKGRLNGSERVAVGLYAIGPNGVPILVGQRTFDRSNCADGVFSLDISAHGDNATALRISPSARLLMCRILHRDTSAPAHLELKGAAAPQGPALTGGSNEAALRQAANSLRANITEYMKWVRAAKKLRNRLDVAPPELTEAVVGDADTQYFLGGFDLAEGEWLEVVLPADLTGYWSLHVYNVWYEHLVTPGVHDRNAVGAADGLIRVAVGPETPLDAVNRIDTLGRRKGAFVCRIVGHTERVSAPQTRLHSAQSGGIS